MYSIKILNLNRNGESKESLKYHNQKGEQHDSAKRLLLLIDLAKELLASGLGGRYGLSGSTSLYRGAQNIGRIDQRKW